MYGSPSLPPPIFQGNSIMSALQLLFVQFFVHLFTYQSLMYTMNQSFSGLPYGDDNNDIYSNDDYEDVASTSTGREAEDGEEVIHTLPHFETAGQSMLVNEGSTIKLPCIVNRLGKMVQVLFG